MGVLSVVVAGLLLAVGIASASTVSYIAGDSVWLSNPSGTQKQQLAGPRTDGYEWTEVAQADNGKVLAVSREPGKIATLNRFTLFAPSGAVLQQGSLTNESGWITSAFPVSLDLTNGGVAVYGYSNSKGFVPNAIFESGTYVRTVEQPFTLAPLKISGWQWPTLFNERLIATSGQNIFVQTAGQSTPFAPNPDIGFLQVPSGFEINRTDVAANGKLFGIELDYRKIELYPISKVPDANGDPDFVVGSGGCVLGVQGDAGNITVSQDGQTIAWEDERGVLAAGAPDFAGSDPCNLTSPPVVIAASGKYPSIGNATISGGGGGGGGGVAPIPTVPARINANGLKKGISISVKVAKAGWVSVTGKVGGTLVARGKFKAGKAGMVRVKLAAVAAYRKKLKRLKGRTLVIKVTANGKSKTVRRVLK